MRLFETQLDENVEQEKPASIDQQGTSEQLSEEETGLMEKAYAFLSAKHVTMRLLFKLGEKGAALVWID